MSYYLRTADVALSQVWWIDDTEARRIGVGDAKLIIGGYFKADPGENIWDAIYRQASGFFGPNGENPFVKTCLGPGEYYPRISRRFKGLTYDIIAQAERNILAISRGQLSALTRQLERICQTVHPEGKSLNTFGHDTRNLLIISCTEVETHWRGVLVANGAAQMSAHLTTSDYFKLNTAMKLDHYAVAFPNYPWLAPFKPYAGWGNTGRPTQKLPWYDAYNATKHDRENSFRRATLQHVFEAIKPNCNYGCSSVWVA